MNPFHYDFSYRENDSSLVSGYLELDEPIPYMTHENHEAMYRPGRLYFEGCEKLQVVLYHNHSTEKFIYLRQADVDENLFNLIGLEDYEWRDLRQIILPGQLCLGADRVRLIGRAISDLIQAPLLKETITDRKQHNLAIFPIAREGLKYQVAEAIYENYGYFCDEIVLDAHHVFDSSVPVYKRKVEMTLFKDKDLDQNQKDNIKVAFIADSIASGLVLKEVVGKVKERFDHIQQIEVIAPLTTIRGLCRIARANCAENTLVRLHVFETLLNALPPDYYYSAHYNVPALHIKPELEKDYHDWWGQDRDGISIADTACAGYGWSEVFFSPRKQIEMINGELHRRHGMKIEDIVRRNFHF